LAELEAQLPLAVKNKSLPVILVCQTGGRASRAEAQAKKLGYERAQAMAGGLKAWREASLPTEKA
jgi:rhodanese-related sulfurtransferase